MIRSVGKLLAMGLIAAGTWAAMPTIPSAQSLDLYIGPGGPELRERRYDDDDYYRRDRGCSERQAIRRAYRLGVRDPEIQSITRREIAVEGVRRGRFMTVYFANRPGCPHIG